MASGRYVVSLSKPQQAANNILTGGLGAADPATHKIYIWDMQNDGQFASALDGGREPLIHVHVCVDRFIPVISLPWLINIKSGILPNPQ